MLKPAEKKPDVLRILQPTAKESPLPSVNATTVDQKIDSLIQGIEKLVHDSQTTPTTISQFKSLLSDLCKDIPTEPLGAIFQCHGSSYGVTMHKPLREWRLRSLTLMALCCDFVQSERLSKKNPQVFSNQLFIKHNINYQTFPEKVQRS